MLNNQDNDRLTLVGPGTAMGALLRRYWHPIAAMTQLDAEPVLPVRLLGEDLVLFRDRAGELGLLGDRCLHRGVHLVCGIPDAKGLRCPYHGWLFNKDGNCVERPFEDKQTQESSRVKTTLRTKAYQVRSMGGLVFAYLGPAPAPVCPDWGVLARSDIHKEVRIGVTPCNWFQIVENAVDPIHHEWLHGHFTNYASERNAGVAEFVDKDPSGWSHIGIDFQRFSYGIFKRRLVAGETRESSEQWKIGHPFIFPNLVWFQRRCFWRVPIDDTHTLNVICIHRPLEEGETGDKLVFQFDPVPTTPEGSPVRWSDATSTHLQDQIAWIAQGPIADRTNENLGHSDKGILLLRRMFFEELEKISIGQEPMNIFASQQDIDLSLIQCAPTLRASAPLPPSLRHSFDEDLRS